jgi:putative intracellular protease/amidase
MKNTLFVAVVVILGIGSPAMTQTRKFIAAQEPYQTKKLNVAIFVFPVVQIIDFATPFEVFQQAGANTYTVAEKQEPIQTNAGLTIVPKYTFDNAPQPDVLVLPGGDGVRDQIANPAVMKWIQETAKHTPQVLTVCSGAFFAAKAGLLDGLSATTIYGALDYLAEVSPTVKVVWDRKYVDSGKVITSAGLSSGMEASLYTVSKVLGMGHAQSVALHMEYNWDPNSTYARAMFPDLYIPDVLPNGLPRGSDLLSSSGDRDHWTITVRIPGEQDRPKIWENINASVAQSGKWSNSAKSATKDNMSRWTFNDRSGSKWESVISLTKDQGPDLLLVVDMHRSSLDAPGASISHGCSHDRGQPRRCEEHR